MDTYGSFPNCTQLQQIKMMARQVRQKYDELFKQYKDHEEQFNVVKQSVQERDHMLDELKKLIKSAKTEQEQLIVKYNMEIEHRTEAESTAREVTAENIVLKRELNALKCKLGAAFCNQIVEELHEKLDNTENTQGSEHLDRHFKSLNAVGELHMHSEKTESQNKTRDQYKETFNYPVNLSDTKKERAEKESITHNKHTDSNNTFTKVTMENNGEQLATENISGVRLQDSDIHNNPTHGSDKMNRMQTVTENPIREQDSRDRDKSTDEPCAINGSKTVRENTIQDQDSREDNKPTDGLCAMNGRQIVIENTILELDGCDRNQSTYEPSQTVTENVIRKQDSHDCNKSTIEPSEINGGQARLSYPLNQLDIGENNRFSNEIEKFITPRQMNDESVDETTPINEGHKGAVQEHTAYVNNNHVRRSTENQTELTQTEKTTHDLRNDITFSDTPGQVDLELTMTENTALNAYSAMKNAYFKEMNEEQPEDVKTIHEKHTRENSKYINYQIENGGRQVAAKHITLKQHDDTSNKSVNKPQKLNEKTDKITQDKNTCTIKESLVTAGENIDKQKQAEISSHMKDPENFNKSIQESGETTTDQIYGGNSVHIDETNTPILGDEDINGNQTNQKRTTHEEYTNKNIKLNINLEETNEEERDNEHRKQEEYTHTNNELLNKYADKNEKEPDAERSTRDNHTDGTTKFANKPTDKTIQIEYLPKTGTAITEQRDRANLSSFKILDNKDESSGTISEEEDKKQTVENHTKTMEELNSVIKRLKKTHYEIHNPTLFTDKTTNPETELAKTYEKITGIVWKNLEHFPDVDDSSH